VLIANPVRALGSALRRTSAFPEDGNPASSRAVTRAEAGARTTTRRSFLKYGAAGITTVAGASLAGDRLWPATARAADPVTKDLFINEGYVRMIDGTPVFMRGFGQVPNTSIPLVPGPAIGEGGATPGTVATVMEDQTVTVNITNGLTDDHAFAIPDVVDPVRIPGTPPGTTPVPVSFTFTAPKAGTYFYFDPLACQRMLGLHGVMVVMPRDGTMRPYGDDRVSAGDLPVPPDFTFQYVWVLHDLDPVWGERARVGTLTTAGNLDLRPDVPELLPRYFTINGVSGEASTLNPRTIPEIEHAGTGAGPAPDATLIRIVNMGAATHSCHFHGNHVFVITDHGLAVERTDPVFERDANGAPVIDPITGQPVVKVPSKPITLEKDVIRMPPQSVKEMLLPGHIPIDQYPPYERDTAFLNKYPMHCHAEMSQTAGGGNYPSGMLADWDLKGAIDRERPVGS
jgi:hypothetical protein